MRTRTNDAGEIEQIPQEDLCAAFPDECSMVEELAGPDPDVYVTVCETHGNEQAD